MASHKIPFVIRWRDGVMDDPNPVLTWRALVAAQPLVRHADFDTGRNCRPSAGRCASDMRSSHDTIKRGWDELEEAGWLEQRPRGQKRPTWKVLRFPASHDADSVIQQDNMTPAASTHDADSVSTMKGDHEARQLDAGSRRMGSEEKLARSLGLVCSGCDRTVGFFTKSDSTLCRDCLGEA